MLLLYIPSGEITCDKENSKRILVLGGNGFLGSETVENLFDKGYEVTLLNRGNYYFDSKSRILPFVKRHIKCDRDTLIRKTCKDLFLSERYDTIIDFSSYNAMQMEQMIDVLKGRISFYIFISSDAVYDVCEKKHKGLTKEDDAVRPSDMRLRDKLNNDNKYGDQKLACEEALRDQRKRGGFPYLIFRLPDAIGPRDTTARIWTYQSWIKFHKALNIPIHLPNGIQQKQFSLVFSKDVAQTIVSSLEMGKAVHDQIINLAFGETLSLGKLLRAIGQCIDIKQIEFNKDEESAWYRFPAVDHGRLDTTLAKYLLNWAPTRFEKALKETCDFFENAMVDIKFAKEREMMLAGFIEDILPDDIQNDDILERTVVDVYGPAALDGIDLGLEVDPDQPRIPSSYSHPTEINKNDSSAKNEGNNYINRESVRSSSDTCDKDKCKNT